MKKNPVSIPHTVWYADDIRRGEREAADALGLTLYELMLRAGEAAFQVCRTAYPDAATGWCCAVMVITAAMATWSRDWPKRSVLRSRCWPESDKPLPEEAALSREAWLNAGGEIHASNTVWPESVDLIVDALLGTGLQQAPPRIH